MALARMRRRERIRAFIAKKMGQGESEKGAMRAFRRYLAREIHSTLKADLSALRHAS